MKLPDWSVSISLPQVELSGRPRGGTTMLNGGRFLQTPTQDNNVEVHR